MLTDWGIQAINAPEVWRQGFQGQGVTVAVIDSGIDVHADLVPNVWVNPAERLNGRDDDGNGYVDDLNGWNFVDDNNNPIGTHNHGTHISGTIAAERNDFGTTGVAYRAKIMPLRVFDEAGRGNTSDIADAVRYAVRNGADIINLSVGGTATRSLNLALEYAAQENVLVVAASGNDGADQPVFPAIHSAEWPHIISVAAHDQNFRAVPASNRVGNSKAVQIDAPGISIYSTVSQNQFANKGGTSSAAAHVAGVAALMISANDGLTAAELRSALVRSASTKVQGSDSVGALNALRAVITVGGGFSAASFSVASEADFNNNGEVDFRDFLTLAKNFGSSDATHKFGDANGDQQVNFKDFLVLAQTYGDTIPISARRENAARQGEVKSTSAEPVAPVASLPVELVAARQAPVEISEPTETTTAETSKLPEIEVASQVERRDFVLLETTEPVESVVVEKEEENPIPTPEPITSVLLASDSSSHVLPAESAPIELELNPIEPELVDEAIGEVADEIVDLSAGGFLLSLFSSRQG